MLKELPNEANSFEDDAIIARVLELPIYQSAQCMLLYLSVGHEVNTANLIDNALKSGKRVCVPRCFAGGVMDAVEISRIDDLVPGRFNIPEPRKELLPINPQELDLIVVPGMAFDRNRNRLGRGAGYYDRFLERADHAVTIGICRSTRLFDSVPVDSHDNQMDVLVTAREVMQKDDA